MSSIELDLSVCATSENSSTRQWLLLTWKNHLARNWQWTPNKQVNLPLVYQVLTQSRSDPPMVLGLMPSKTCNESPTCWCQPIRCLSGPDSGQRLITIGWIMPKIDPLLELFALMKFYASRILVCCWSWLTISIHIRGARGRHEKCRGCPVAMYGTHW